jgi:hypothetical protein
VFGLKLEIRIQLIDRLPKSLWVPDHLTDGCLIIGLQHAFEGGGDNGHGFQRDVVLVDPLQIGPRATTVLWWRDPFASKTDRIVALRVPRQHGFQAQLTFPVIDEVVDVAEALPSMSAQRHELHVARINTEAGTTKTRAALLLAMETKAMEMHIAPGEDELQRGIEGGQGHVAADEEPAPNQRTDALHDHAELVDARWDA